ncbi:MAG: hypothetical protein IJC83_00045 [Oscillospiraceae bacterium]|nr:hypothetical protein [Oscillospiraceae bacterium]
MQTKLNCFYENSSKLYSINLGETLIDFIEFDFAEFKQQTLDFFSEAKTSGAVDNDKLSDICEIAYACHPYIKAGGTTDFLHIATDCYIKHLCENGKTIDALWQEVISPQNQYEELLFKRVSEYKTSRAVNCYNILIACREYAKQKTDFIFGQNPDYKTVVAYKAYSNYIFSAADWQLTSESGNVTSVRDPFYLFNLWSSNEVSEKLVETIKEKIEALKLTHNPNFYDDIAATIVEALAPLMGEEGEEFREIFAANSQVPFSIYIPQSFIAAINLEFDKIVENEAMLIRCMRCGRYFIKHNKYHIKYCDRADENGKVCRDIAASELFNQKRKTDDMEKRCHCIYYTINRRIDKDLTDDEFREWANKLSELKAKYKADELALDELMEYLDNSLVRYGGKKKSGRPTTSTDEVDEIEEINNNDITE